MTNQTLMTQSQILRLAQAGDTGAIAELMQRVLHRQGIEIQMALKQDCLQIILEAVQVPDQPSLTAFVQQGLAKLNPASIRRVKVYGRQTGEAFLDWHTEFELKSQSSSIDEHPLPAICSASTAVSVVAQNQVMETVKELSPTQIQPQPVSQTQSGSSVSATPTAVGKTPPLSTKCPQCGSSMSRVPRKQLERLLGFPTRRYYCSKCDWVGAKVKGLPLFL